MNTCSIKCANELIDSKTVHVNRNKSPPSIEVQQLIVDVYQQGLSLFKTKIELLTHGFDITNECIESVLREAKVMRNKKQLKGARIPPKYKTTKTCKHCNEEFKQLFARHVFCDACVPKDGGDWSYKISKYCISRREYDAMLFEQGNKCAICKKKFASFQDTHIDHNHVTGEVRGLLCNKCNNMLKSFEDAMFVENANMYLAAKKDYRINK